MPWKAVTVMSQRKDFVSLALAENANISELCRRFGISRKTGYKWIERFRAEGDSGIADRSRRPKSVPVITPEEMERAIVRVRKRHRSWGGRKICKRLKNLGWQEVPAPSTITDILRRNGLLDPGESSKHQPWQRFEAEAPNDLWQMDFKGHVPVADGRCHPLTVLDDHSRYSLGIQACSNERDQTVRNQLVMIFRRFGIPKRLLVDNGSPWGSADPDARYTALTVWLMRIGITVVHSRPYHPQTMGKDERFHRTLKAEVLQYCSQLSIEGCQKRFDEWRNIYNYERPHESLLMEVPGSRYRFSNRSYTEELPPIEYGPDDTVRKVDQARISFHCRRFRIGKAFNGEYIALRPTNADGVYDVMFSNHKIDEIDLTSDN
jgi:transposase InsO family protein